MAGLLDSLWTRLKALRDADTSGLASSSAAAEGHTASFLRWDDYDGNPPTPRVRVQMAISNAVGLNARLCVVRFDIEADRAANASVAEQIEGRLRTVYDGVDMSNSGGWYFGRARFVRTTPERPTREVQSLSATYVVTASQTAALAGGSGTGLSLTGITSLVPLECQINENGDLTETTPMAYTSDTTEFTLGGQTMYSVRATFAYTNYPPTLGEYAATVNVGSSLDYTGTLVLSSRAIQSDAANGFGVVTLAGVFTGDVVEI